MPDYEGMILDRADTFDECGYCEQYEYGKCPGQCYYDNKFIESWEEF